MYIWIIIFYCSSAFSKEAQQDLNNPMENNQIRKSKKPEIDINQQPDKELLLFLSEFSDAQGNWLDPEIFSQTIIETIKPNTEIEEQENEIYLHYNH